MRKLLMVMAVLLLAACQKKANTYDTTSAVDYTVGYVEDCALDEEEPEEGFYAFETDSTIKDFIYFDCDTVKQVVLPYCAVPSQLDLIHSTIDDIIIEKGWRHPFEDWCGFEEELKEKLPEGVEFTLGELEVEI